MAKNFWDADSAEHSRFSEPDHSRVIDHTDERVVALQDEQPFAPSSQICPDTGKLTMHTAEDLRAMLDKDRLGQAPSRPEVSSEPQKRNSVYRCRDVIVDDELRGEDGERMVVNDISDDGAMFTVFCNVKDTSIRMPVRDVLHEVWSGRLRVCRYVELDIPKEWD